jgi:hypothetical protein
MGLFGVGLLAYRRSDAPTKYQSSFESFYVTLLIAALTKLFWHDAKIFARCSIVDNVLYNSELRSRG